MIKVFTGVLVLFLSQSAWGDPGIEAFSVQTSEDGNQTYTLTLQIMLMMTALTLLPGLVLAMTSFTRIIVVLAILRQALGTAQTPSSQILIGLALIMTLFIMAPVIETVYGQAVQPYLDEEIDVSEALARAEVPVRDFMLSQTRESDLLVNRLRSDDSTIVCDEEGSLDPVSWSGSIESLGDDYLTVLRYQEERVLKVDEHRGRITIRGRDRVGFVRLPSGRRILIRTKVPGLALLDWLVYLEEFPEVRFWDDDGNVSQSVTYQALLARLFLRELDIVTRCHMRKGFVQSDVESSHVRGRISSNLLAQRLWRLPAIPQTVRCRSIDTPPNQMLAAALDRILSFSSELERRQLADFQQLRHAWSGISRSNEDREYIIQSSLSAPPAGYRSALQLARLILTGATFDPTPGWGGDAFTISLARIWENAVTKMCRNCLVRQTGKSHREVRLYGTGTTRLALTIPID